MSLNPVSEESRALPKHLGLPVTLLVLIGVTADLIVGCRLLGTAFRALQLGASPLWLGVLAAGPNVTYAGGLALIGPRLDRLRRRVGVTVGLALYVLIVLGHYYATEKWHLAVLALLFGAAGTLLWPPLLGWFCDLAAGDTRRLNRMVGNFNLAWSGGLTAGVLTAGALWGVLEIRLFPTLAVLGVLAALGLIFVPEGPRATAVLETEDEETPHDQNRAFRICARLANLLSWFGAGTMLTIVPKLFQTLSLPASRTGIAIAAFYLAILVFNYVGRNSSRWQFRRWPVLLPLALVALSAGLLLVVRGAPLFTFACFLTGVGAAFSSVTSIYYSVHGRPEKRAAGGSMNEMIAGTAGLVGSLLSGFVAQRLGAWHTPEAALRETFVLVIGLAVGVAVWQGVVWRKGAVRL